MTLLGTLKHAWASCGPDNEWKQVVRCRECDIFHRHDAVRSSHTHPRLGGSAPLRAAYTCLHNFWYNALAYSLLDFFWTAFVICSVLGSLTQTLSSHDHSKPVLSRTVMATFKQYEAWFPGIRLPIDWPRPSPDATAPQAAIEVSLLASVLDGSEGV